MICSPELIHRLADPFFAEGASRVFVARCCNRVFVGTREATSCATCKQPVANHPCTSVDEALKFADPQP